jgi:Cof subfamily protein (haloacid dehalogenase superfamily)
MLKLVFVDMDDTFLCPDKSISPENMAVLDHALQHGVQFVPCTGRNVTGLPSPLVEHDCVNYAVCCNGTLIRDVRSGQILHEVAIDKASVAALYRQVKHLNISFDLFADGTVYTVRDRWHALEEMPVDEPMRQQIMGMRTIWEGSVEDLLNTCGNICRLNVFYLDAAARDAVWSAIDADPGLRRTSSLCCNIEITNVDGHKGSGLSWLCDHLDVDVADTIAFGDAGNDVTMLQAAGDGVAMANATAEAKAAADHICGSCAESGVARYLEPILQNLPCA